jgi:GABA(A) receptor-associated protein
MSNLQTQVKHFQVKYPDRIPIIINPVNDKQPGIDKRKYLVNKDMLLGEFMHNIKKRINIESEQAIFIMIRGENILPCMTKTACELYEIYKKENVLYLEYSVENTFGIEWVDPLNLFLNRKRNRL